jgi:hypothetical protein
MVARLQRAGGAEIPVLADCLEQMDHRGRGQKKTAFVTPETCSKEIIP